MTLTDKDLEAMRLLMREEISTEITPLRKEMNERFSEVKGDILQLTARFDTFKQEWDCETEQNGRKFTRIIDHLVEEHGASRDELLGED